MAIPVLIAAALRQVAVQTAKHAASSKVKPSKKLGSKASIEAKRVKDINKVAEADLRNQRGQAAKAATKAGNDKLKAEAAERGLKGAAREQYIKSNRYRVAADRSAVKSTFDGAIKDIKNNVTSSASTAGKQAFNSLMKGDIAGAGKSIESSAKSALRRASSDLKSGHTLGHPLTVNTGSKSVDKGLDSVLKSFSRGGSLTEAATEELKQYVELKARGKILKGAEATRVAKMAGDFNTTLNKLKSIKSLPERTARKYMSDFFTEEDGKYYDKDDNEWSMEDVEVATTQVYEAKPESSSDPEESIKRAMNPLTRAVVGHSARKRAFYTSFNSAGMQQGAPRLFNDLMLQINNMGPGDLLTLIYSGESNGVITYFNSDRNSAVGDARKLVRAVGLDVNDYKLEELTW